MANQIAKFKKYIDLLDEVYKNAAKTAVLESDATLAQQGANANEIVIPKLDMDGLGDYDRNSGYVDGDVTMTNETVQFNYDRGRKFSVDAMDNEETAGLAFGKLAAEFVRTKVVPEQDAFRFATYANLAGTKVSGTLADGAAVLTALQTATSAMDDAEVPTEDRHLFITPALLVAAQNVDTTKSRDILGAYASITKVPTSRFYTAIDLKDGKTSGETAGGYAKHASTGESDPAGKDINFMVIEKSAILQFTKHNVNKAIAPEDNPDADAWIFNFREYGLADAYENKTAGIYLHHKA
nr:MAG TPA: Major capsid protein [Caudoviricetes sp.]